MSVNKVYYVTEGYAVPDDFSESPYGWRATQIGYAALRAVADLSVEPEYRGGTSRRWIESDYTAFAGVANCIDTLQRTEFVTMPDFRRRDSFREQVGQLYATLPFTVAERAFLTFESSSLSHYTDPVSPKGYASIIKRSGRRTYEAGRPREIDGRDIVNAWWAWRRGVLEYADRYFEDETGRHLRAVDMTRGALGEIGDILLPTYL